MSLIVLLGACTTISTDDEGVLTPVDSQRFDSLLALNDLNERAFEYHQFCLKDTEPMSAVFMDNYKLVANMLYDETVETIGWEPEFIVRQVLERRQKIQNLLNRHYRTEGCQSQEAMTARAHYLGLSQVGDNYIQGLITP